MKKKIKTILIIAGVGASVALCVWAYQSNNQISPIAPAAAVNGSSTGFDPTAYGAIPVGQDAVDTQTQTPSDSPATPSQGGQLNVDNPPADSYAPVAPLSSSGESPTAKASRCDAEAMGEINLTITQGYANAEATVNPQVQEYQNAIAQFQQDVTTMVSNTSQAIKELGVQQPALQNGFQPAIMSATDQINASAQQYGNLASMITAEQNEISSYRTAIATLESNLQQEENNIRVQAESSYAMLYQECLNKN